MVKRVGATHYEPISWDDAFRLIGDRTQRAPDSECRRILHQRADEQRSRVFVSAFRSAIRHEQPARLFEHVPRIERRGDERNHRDRQGLREAGGLRPRGRDLHHRAKPGHESSADAQQPRQREGPGSEDRLDQSVARSRQLPVQKSAGPEEPAEGRRRIFRRGHEVERPLAAAANQRRCRSSQGHDERNAGRGREASRLCLRSRFHSRIHSRLRGIRRRSSRDQLGRYPRQQRSDARSNPGRRRNRDAVEADHLLLGDGIDPAQERGRHYPGNRQLSPARREHWPAREPGLARCADIPMSRAIAPWGSGSE